MNLRLSILLIATVFAGLRGLEAATNFTVGTGGNYSNLAAAATSTTNPASPQGLPLSKVQNYYVGGSGNIEIDTNAGYCSQVFNVGDVIGHSWTAGNEQMLVTNVSNPALLKVQRAYNGTNDDNSIANKYLFLADVTLQLLNDDPGWANFDSNMKGITIMPAPGADPAPKIIGSDTGTGVRTGYKFTIKDLMITNFDIGIEVAGGNTIIQNCEICGNNGGDWQGGIKFVSLSGVLVERCYFHDNSPYAMVVSAFDDAITYRNNLITDPCRLEGNNKQYHYFYNNTFANAGTIRLRQGSSGVGADWRFINNIFYNGNYLEFVYGTDPWQITSHHECFYGNSKIAIVGTNYYNTLTDWQAAGYGTNSIAVDPVFMATNDYHLQRSSLCIDTGTNMIWAATATDLDGNPRLDRTVDMGAYEYVHPPAGTAISIR